MQKVETNEIPNLLKTNQITELEATKLLWLDIYTHPEKYNLSNFNEDDLSELLINIQSRFLHLIKSYDENKTDFITFIRSCLSFFKITWQRQSLKKLAEEKSLNYEIKAGIVEAAPLFDSKSDPSKINFDFDFSNKISDSIESKKNITEAKETALILALKACADVDDEIIKKLSNFLQRTEDELHNLISDMRNMITQKEEKRDLMVVRRNNSFFKKRKYAIELTQLEKNCSEYKKIEELYKNQIKNWQKNNENLEHRYIMAPKNSDIAKLLGISTRKVYYCISHAKEEEILQNFNKIYENESKS